MKRAFVTAFLKEFKEVAEQKGVYLVGREKNRQAIADLRITEALAKDEILSLSAADYCAGPKPDENRQGDIWEFGRNIGGVDVYIKLKVAVLPDGEKIAKCISFHPAEHALRFPLRGKGERRAEL